MTARATIPDLLGMRLAHRIMRTDLHRRQQPQVPHPPPDDVPVCPTLQPAQADEFPRQPVRRGERQPGALGQCGQRQRPVLGVERPEQREHPRRHAGPRRRQIPRHAAILPLSGSPLPRVAL